MLRGERGLAVRAERVARRGPAEKPHDPTRCAPVRFQPFARRLDRQHGLGPGAVYQPAIRPPPPPPVGLMTIGKMGGVGTGSIGGEGAGDGGEMGPGLDSPPLPDTGGVGVGAGTGNEFCTTANVVVAEGDIWLWTMNVPIVVGVHTADIENDWPGRSVRFTMSCGSTPQLDFHTTLPLLEMTNASMLGPVKIETAW